MSVDLRLYALVDPQIAGGHDLPELAWRIAQGGATLVQLRDKHGSTRSMVETARAIRARVAPLGVPLLINDRADVAFAAGADGVHLGQDDMAVQDARRLLGPHAAHTHPNQDRFAPVKPFPFLRRRLDREQIVETVEKEPR